jgi:hypothetical protein
MHNTASKLPSSNGSGRLQFTSSNLER